MWTYQQITVQVKKPSGVRLGFTIHQHQVNSPEMEIFPKMGK
jgi:hypothetical protein